MRSGDRCRSTLPRHLDDATTVAGVLKKRGTSTVSRSVGSAQAARALGTVRAVAGSNADRIVARTGRMESGIARTLAGAVRPVVAGHLMALAVILSGFLAVGDLSGWALPVARLALAGMLVWLARRLGRRLGRMRVGVVPVTLPSQVSVLWLAMLPWLLMVWLAAPLVFGWAGVGLPYAVSGGVMALTLVSALVLSVRAVAAQRIR